MNFTDIRPFVFGACVVVVVVVVVVLKLASRFIMDPSYT